MSMTLILWKAPVVEDPEEAQALLQPWYDIGDDSCFDYSADLAAVHRQLVRQYPTDWEGSGSPWADPPEETGKLLVLSICWGTDSPILADITVLAKKHDLVLYDPQGPDVFLPTDPLDSGPIPLPTAWEWFKCIAIAVFLMAMTYAAWLIPIGWIRWPAVIVTGFLAAAALFVAGAMIAGVLGFVDADERG